MMTPSILIETLKQAVRTAGELLREGYHAAGIVFAREASCAVTDLAGAPSPDEWTSLLVAHPERHGELREILAAL